VPCAWCFRLLALSQQVLTDNSVPDEVLFGRSGYLLALLFVRHHLGAETVPQSIVSQVRIGARLRPSIKFPYSFDQLGDIYNQLTGMHTEDLRIVTCQSMIFLDFCLGEGVLASEMKYTGMNGVIF